MTSNFSFHQPQNFQPDSKFTSWTRNLTALSKRSLSCTCLHLLLPPPQPSNTVTCSPVPPPQGTLPAPALCTLPSCTQPGFACLSHAKPSKPPTPNSAQEGGQAMDWGIRHGPREGKGLGGQCGNSQKTEDFSRSSSPALALLDLKPRELLHTSTRRPVPKHSCESKKMKTTRTSADRMDNVCVFSPLCNTVKIAKTNKQQERNIRTANPEEQRQSQKSTRAAFSIKLRKVTHCAVEGGGRKMGGAKHGSTKPWAVGSRCRRGRGRTGTRGDTAGLPAH